MNTTQKLIGVDMGATNVRAGLVIDGNVVAYAANKLPVTKGYDEVLDTIFATIDQIYQNDVISIGIGVPSVVERKSGVVYNVQNIPSWVEVPLKALLEGRYGKEAQVNNDANCFALGEKIYGIGQSYQDFVGLAIGTGIGGGIISNGKLLRDVNCGAGEFGEMPYRDSKFEDYCSGVFFDKFYNTNAENIFNHAANGDHEALNIVDEFAFHLGTLIKTIICAVDPEAIIIGGSIAKAASLYNEKMQKVVNTFPYPRTIEKLTIKYSNLSEVQVLGAAALYLDNL